MMTSLISFDIPAKQSFSVRIFFVRSRLHVHEVSSVAAGVGAGVVELVVSVRLTASTCVAMPAWADSALFPSPVACLSRPNPPRLSLSIRTALKDECMSSSREEVTVSALHVSRLKEDTMQVSDLQRRSSLLFHMACAARGKHALSAPFP